MLAAWKAGLFVKKEKPMQQGMPMQQEAPVQQEARKVFGYCENCGAERDEDACVCVKCGTKFED